MFHIRKPIRLRLDQRAVLDHRNGHGGHVLFLHPSLDDIIDVLRANRDRGNKNECKKKKKVALAIHVSLRPGPLARRSN